jgi:hypothetical protein
LPKNLLYHPGSSFTELKNVLKIDKNLLKHPGSSLTLKNCAKIVKKKTPKRFWFFFTELKNVLKITEKPP